MKFQSLLLTFWVVLCKTKGRLNSACIKCHGVWQWNLAIEGNWHQQSCLKRDANGMVDVPRLRDGKSSGMLQNRLGVANIIDVLHQARLRWFWHVEIVDKENPVNNLRFVELGCQRGKCSPFKAWTQLINDDLRKLRLQSGLAQNRLVRIKTIRETPSNPC